MHRRAKVVLLAALGATLGGVGCAGTREARSDVASIIPGVEQKRVGVITGIQGQNISVASVEDPAATPAWFHISAETVVGRGEQRVSLDDLDEGTPVRVSFEPATGPERTVRVEVLTGPEAEEVRQKARQLGYD